MELIDTVLGLQDDLVAEYRQAAGMFGELARIEALLAETYRDRVQYELLQNSDDAGSRSVEIEVSSSGRVVWRNDGRAMTGDDASALCRSASSTKTRGDTIGYRGIGFKSLAAVASRITVATAGCAFTFDRQAAAELLSTAGHHAGGHDVPLVRLPTAVTSTPNPFGAGVTFTIDPHSPNLPVLGPIDPIALLFLRTIESVTIQTDGRTHQYRAVRNGQQLELHWDDRVAHFVVLTGTCATVALPLNAQAVSLCTARGRLACFLPLNDRIGAPLVVSGDLLTDPSRTHATVADPSTTAVLQDAAAILANELRNPASAWFERAWELMTIMEDPRSLLATGGISAEQSFLTALREELRHAAIPFAVAPFAVPDEDLNIIFPAGAPRALYDHTNIGTARALRVAFGLPNLDVGPTIGQVVTALSPATQSAAAQYVTDHLRALGRSATPVEQMVLDTVQNSAPAELGNRAAERAEPAPPRQVAPREGFADVMQRWRTAEIAVMDWLNARGWDLKDVSKQNLGYDLVGVDNTGIAVMLEVKKVDRPDARFSMTNNEMGAIEAEPGQYLLGIVIGDGRYARLMLLDPKDRALPRERVCRAWEWQFTAWAEYGQFVDG